MYPNQLLCPEGLGEQRSWPPPAQLVSESAALSTPVWSRLVPQQSTRRLAILADRVRRSEVEMVELELEVMMAGRVGSEREVVITVPSSWRPEVQSPLGRSRGTRMAEERDAKARRRGVRSKRCMMPEMLFWIVWKLNGEDR